MIDEPLDAGLHRTLARRIWPQKTRLAVLTACGASRAVMARLAQAIETPPVAVEWPVRAGKTLAAEELQPKPEERAPTPMRRGRPFPVISKRALRRIKAKKR